MKPGHGEVLIAEGDVDVAEDEELLVEAFRRQLDQGMWAAVPDAAPPAAARRRWSSPSRTIPRDADRVIFFPRAAGGAESQGRPRRCCSPSSATAIVIVALLWEVVLAALEEVERHRARRAPSSPARLRPRP